ncbi:hypothetical protein NPA31_003025 [Aurantimonas sp. MSK8Z-1]|uniref:hypothetical protein n=1 Tax=Mangrovibrevibacter kandeliae TaxID=2968473 RepID=UPI0021192702|nr:hypothetical protein [Aurantimonas sp. MSK8Z-1]MCW4113937.1 hypothetical protein [Aurantimonas sp. MSK8Z-1]
MSTRTGHAARAVAADTTGIGRIDGRITTGAVTIAATTAGLRPIVTTDATATITAGPTGMTGATATMRRVANCAGETRGWKPAEPTGAAVET